MRVRLAVAAAAVTTIAVGSVAMAATIDDVELKGGTAIWDPENNAGTNDDCTAPADDAYTPTDDGGLDLDGDGSTGGANDETDAFDGGWMVTVNGDPFFDDDGEANKDGKTLKPGPESLGDFRVSRIDTALKQGPALRMLVKLSNTKGQTKGANIGVFNDFGADDAEVVRTSSNGDKKQQKGDRWVVERDSDDSDPTNTLVYSGKGGKGISEVTDAVQNGNGCANVRFHVSIPGKSARYLLFFNELHRIDDAGEAAKDAKKYDGLGSGSKLLKGVSGGIKNHIVNWKF